MATIYIDVPVAQPERIIIEQASSLYGDRVQVVNALYTSFPQSAGRVVIDSADISSAKYSYVFFLSDGEISAPFTIYPLDDLSTTAQAIFDKALPMMAGEPPTGTFLDTLARVIRYMDRRLFEHESDLILVSRTATLSTGEHQVPLPARMLGMREHPYYSHSDSLRTELTPIPRNLVGTFAEPSLPQYYEIRGSVMVLTPAADRSIVVHYETFERSVAPVAMADVVPYNGHFDQIIIDLIAKFAHDPLGSYANEAIEYATRAAVDSVVLRRAPKQVRWVFNL